MTRKDFRVLIAGAGVAGLTLANTLEQLGIDFLVLEAYHEVSPQVGASIGLWPNGIRLLDQLGVADEFAAGVDRLNHLSLRIRDELKAKGWGVANHTLMRHGYPVIFNDRQRLLEVLYKRLAQKDKVLMGKRVARVEELSSEGGGVRVVTEDKHAYEGSILVGADGVHSAVRREMWRLAASSSPGYFPPNVSREAPVRYRCLFGISTPTPSLPSTLVTPVWNAGFSHLIFGGPGGRIYFFLFEKLAETVYGEDAPRYSKKDEAELAERHRADVISEEVTFGQMYDNRTSSALTVLHEHVFDKWYFGRIITLGDAAHKPNPITGQGGNAAMESVAALANALTARLDAASASNRTLSDRDITAAFAETQEVRHARAVRTVDIACKVQQTEALENPATELIAPFLIPLLSDDVRLERQSTLIVDAVRIDGLPVPPRPHFVPYADELPARPLEGFVASVLPRLVAALALVAVRVALADRTIALGRMGELPARLVPARKRYTGIAGVDAIMVALVGSFYSVLEVDPVPRDDWSIPTLYILAMVTAVWLIWTVEGYRRGNAQTLFGRLVLWPVVYFTVCQLITAGKTAPIYFLASLLSSSSPLYARTSGRPVDPAVARALLPALTLTYVVPTALLFLRLERISLWQDVIALWQLAPMLFSAATKLLAIPIRRRMGVVSRVTGGGRVVHNPALPLDVEMYEGADVSHLLGAYAAVGWATAAVHLTVVFYVLASPRLSLAAVLGAPVGAVTRWDLLPEDAAFGDRMALLLRYDLISLVAAVAVWCLHSVAEMRRLGYVRSREAVRAGVLALFACMMLGPGAMYTGLWYWRETVIWGLSERAMAGETEKRKDDVQEQ